MIRIARSWTVTTYFTPAIFLNGRMWAGPWKMSGRGPPNQALHPQRIKHGRTHGTGGNRSNLSRPQRACQIGLEKNVFVGFIQFETFAIETGHVVRHTGSFFQKHS